MPLPSRASRVAGLAPHELSAEQRPVYEALAGGSRTQGPQVFRLTDDAGRLRGPFNAMLLSPPHGDALQNLGAAVRGAGSESAGTDEEEKQS